MIGLQHLVSLDLMQVVIDIAAFVIAGSLFEPLWTTVEYLVCLRNIGQISFR